MIKIVYKEPQKKAVQMEVENTLEKFQELVGGYIEVIPANDDGNILMIINEEGKIKKLESNVWIGDTCIVGNVVFALRGKNGDFESLTDEMIKAIFRVLSI